MSDAKYLKCPCQKCGGSIEFPAAGLGVGINCPHCGERTILFAPEFAVVEVTEGQPFSPSRNLPHPESESELPAENPTEKRVLNAQMAIAVIVLLLLGGAGAGAFYLLKHQRESPPKAGPTASVKTNEIVAAANEPAPAAPPTPISPKSIADLKVGAIMLEKAKSGSLVYAVGVLKNDSDYARYGVKIELDLSDAKGSRASKATDYTQVIEPRKEWRFRALILDSKAISAKLSKVTEDD